MFLMFLITFLGKAQELRSSRPLNSSIPRHPKPISGKKSTINNPKPQIKKPVNLQDIDDEDEEDELDRLPLSYPMQDRRGNNWEEKQWNTFLRLGDHDLLRNNTNYDPQTRSMSVIEKLGSADFRKPRLYLPEEYSRLHENNTRASYLQKRNAMMFFMNNQGGLPRFSASDYLFNSVFGINDKANQLLGAVGNNILQIGKQVLKLDKMGSITNAIKLLDTMKNLKDKAALRLKIKLATDSLRKQFLKKIFSINPEGFVDFTLGWESFENNIPTIPENLRTTSAPILDMQYDLNLNAQVGSKLKLPLSLSNLSNFNLSNPFTGLASSFKNNFSRNLFSGASNPFQLTQLMRNIRVNYEGSDDQIIQNIDLGGTSFNSEAKLIPSVNNIFGVRTKLKFGRLSINSVLGLQLSKIKTIVLENGGLVNKLHIKASDYEKNRNYLLAHYFRKNYNQAMASLPLVNSRAQILRVEVWITNRNRSVDNAREVIGLADLGECAENVGNPNYSSCQLQFPDNRTNNLYAQLQSQVGIRSNSSAVGILNGLGLQQGKDYEIFYAYKLPENAYTFNPFVGFLMIHENISEEFAVSVAYEYMLDGKHYQVGEFSNQIYVQPGGSPQIILSKLLKPIFPRTDLPIWKLMMKNVYNLGWGGIKKHGFRVQVSYQDPGSMENVYLPFATADHRKNIVSLINSDRLNNNNDLQSDGIFDFVENYTIFPERSKMVFPVLEPFGRDLEYVVPAELRKRYVFYALYDSIQINAKLQINLDRFYISGDIQKNDRNQIFLGATNIQPGSVRIFQGALPLREQIDFSIDYNVGILTILNQGIIDAALPLTVHLEDNTTGGLQQKSFLGVKLDYQLLRNLHLGAALTKYTENPFNLKTPADQDPVNNIIYGVNADYKIKFPSLSWALDKLLPFYVTEAMSYAKLHGELASMVPGSSRLIGKGKQATVYLDDFETSNISIPLSISPTTNWHLASTPKGAVGPNGQILFPEADAVNDLKYGFQRAKIAWYQIENNLQDPNLPNNPARSTNLEDHRWRQINTNELFPSTSVDIGRSFLRTFDLAYYPQLRGPYNFTTNLTTDGNLQNPEQKWAGIMTSFQDQVDFNNRNIQFIEFWLQDPFVYDPGSNGGYLYFDLGNLSEDILRDNLRMYENGLPTPEFPSNVIDSKWGRVPGSIAQATNTFTNNLNNRRLQDLGLDGLDEIQEREKFSEYLNQVRQKFGQNSDVYNRIFSDPSADNFVSYRDPSFSPNATILERYLNFNGTEGNSSSDNVGGIITTAKIQPDGEDINNDNLMNTSEDYFQYRLNLKPNMQVGDINGFIVDKRTINITSTPVNWYLFRIPLTAFSSKIGNISNFNSIRFMRMFLTGFQKPVVMRMTNFSLVAPSWRKFEYVLNNNASYQPLLNPQTYFLVSPISIEQNDARVPIPYALPPGIERIQQSTLSNANVLLNEQSLSLKVRGLRHKDARGVFKIFNKNLVQYGKLDMFFHAEGTRNSGELLRDGDLTAVVRIGNDMVNNYYEISIPLKITNIKGIYTREDIWPADNNLNLDLRILPKLKLRRDGTKRFDPNAGFYQETINGRNYSIVGNPSLALVSTILVALKNSSGEDVNAELWINELRLSDLNQETGYAGYGNADFQLADLGTMTLLGSFHTSGFGGIEQKVSERIRDNFSSFGIISNLELGKITPDALNITIPFYMNYAYSRSLPKFDPYYMDVESKDRLALYADSKIHDSIRDIASEISVSQLYSFSNVHLIADSNRPIHFYTPALWKFSYTYSNLNKISPKVEQYQYENQYASLVYNYDVNPLYLYPFKKFIKRKSLMFLRQLGFNFYLSALNFQVNVHRSFTMTRPRNAHSELLLPEYYSKYFVMDRIYSFRWQIAPSLSMTYNAKNSARIDEPDGKLDTRNKRELVLQRLFQGGRTVNFSQNVAVNYELPLQLFKGLDWVRINLQYDVNYRWVSASTSAIQLGNTIYNMQRRGANLNFNFQQLFGKFKNLRINEGKFSWSNIFLTWIENIRFSYQERLSTTMPGFIPSPQVLGNNWNSMAPGLGFILGKQFNRNDLDLMGNKGWVSRDLNQNSQFLQTYEHNMHLNLSLSPLVFFNLQLDFDYKLGRNYTELFKNIGDGNLGHYNNYSSGRFEVSYWGLSSFFDSYDKTGLTKGFQQFLALRQALSAKIGKLNPASSLDVGSGYYRGYNQYAQDVLVSSFLGAYTGKDVENTPLLNYNPDVRANPFRQLLPLPNWRLSFSGLSQIPGIKKVFPQILLSNSYSGTFSANAVASNPTYEEFDGRIGVPAFIDPSSGNFVPYYRIPNITIVDRFEPLIGIDITTIKNTSLGFKINQERTVSLSLVDYQVSENFRSGFVINFSQRFQGPVLFKRLINEKNIGNKQNIALRFDVNYSKDYNNNVRLNQGYKMVTGGNFVLSILPALEYNISRYLLLRVFYEYRGNQSNLTLLRNINQRGGVTIRLTFGD